MDYQRPHTIIADQDVIRAWEDDRQLPHNASRPSILVDKPNPTFTGGFVHSGNPGLESAPPSAAITNHRYKPNSCTLMPTIGEYIDDRLGRTGGEFSHQNAEERQSRKERERKEDEHVGFWAVVCVKAVKGGRKVKKICGAIKKWFLEGAQPVPRKRIDPIMLGGGGGGRTRRGPGTRK